MDDLDESELPSSQASLRVIQSPDIRIPTTDEELKYRKKLFPEPKSVLKSKIQCTACGTSLMKQVNKGRDLYFHPMLQVLICEDCRAFYGDGIFPLDDDNSDKYCRWCAQGGSLYCCSACNFVFCKSCIRRNFKKSMMEEIEEEDWKCFMCNPEALWMHRAVCAAARKYVKENPGDEDEEDIQSSNDERRREKRMRARENSRQKGRSSIDKSERTKRSKSASHPARRSRRLESSDDDDDDDNDDDRAHSSKKQEREKSKRKKKEDEKYHRSKRSAKDKEASDKGDDASDDDDDEEEDRRHKKKRLKDRDKGHRQEEKKVEGKGPGVQEKGKERSIPSPNRSIADDDKEMVSVGECSKSLNQGDKDEDARQIAVLRKTCHTMLSLSKEAFSISYVATKKTQKIYKWISEKNKVSNNYLPTTPAMCTKMINTFKGILSKLSGNIDELQGKVLEAEKEWMNIVEENNASERELGVDKSHNKKDNSEGNESERDSQEKEESTLITDETRLVNGDSVPPEDAVVGNEMDKTRASEDNSLLDNGIAENIERLTSGSKGERVTENHNGEEDSQNASASDCDRSLASAPTVRLETSSVDDKAIDMGNEKVRTSSGEEVETTCKKKQSKTVSSSKEDDINGINTEDDISESGKEKVSNEKESDESKKSNDEECVDNGSTSGGDEEMDKRNNVSSDVDMEDNNPVSPDSTMEDAVNSTNKSGKESTMENAVNSTNKSENDGTKLEEGEKSRFENSVQDIFATDEEGDNHLNKIAESNKEIDSDGKGLVVGKDSSLVEEGTVGTSVDATKEVSVNGEEQKDDSDSDLSDSKVKPTSDDNNAKFSFLLDTSLSSNDSDSAQKSKGKRIHQKNVGSSGSESVSDIVSDESKDKKVSRTKKGKYLFAASEVVARCEDEKLKAGCFVSLEKLKHQHYRQVDLKIDSKKRDSMARAINRLGNFSNLEKPQNNSESDSDEGSVRKKKKKKKTKVKKKSLTKDSEEDSLKDSSENGLDSDGSDIDKIMAPSKLDGKSEEKMLDALAAELLANSSSLDSSSSDEDSDAAKKKADDSESKKKIKKKEKEKNKEMEIKEEKDISTDDEEDISKAKWKRDKLLRAKLSATDSSEEEKRWRKKKEKEKETSSDSGDDSDCKALKTRKKVRRGVADSDSDILEVSSNSVKSSDASDFEVTMKKRKRKNRSDSSSDKSTGSIVKKKKKLRRIKMVNSDSDSDVMSVEEKEKEKEKEKKKEKEEPVKGKINRKAMKGRLAEETKAAARDEEERIKRITERQKLYNDIFTDTQNLEDVKEVILDFDPDTKKPLVSVHPTLVKKLKPHQAEGVRFMWDACFESLKRMEESDGSGCILAHCMGLGKTLQVIALVHTLLTNPKTKVHTVLVVCPLNTVLNWVSEFNCWLKDLGSGEDVEVFELTKYKVNAERMYQLKDWKKDGGVMIIGYEMYRNLSSTNSKRISKKFSLVFQSTLVDPGPDLIICDEGHLLKNIQSALSKAVNSIKTQRRIVLTGTPLQNNLKEYHCMIQFVKPSLLGTPKEFYNRFVTPITNGQLAESTPHDVRVMKRRAHVLHKMLEGCVQRRDYSVLTPFLPPKYEYVIGIQLTELQSKLYVYYLENLAKMKGGTTLFNDFQHLQRIWTHPRLLKIKADNEEKKRLLESDSEGSLKDFICDDDTTTEESSSDSNNSDKKRITRRSGKKKKEGSIHLGSGSDSDVVCVSEEEKESKEEDENEPKDGPTGPKEWWETFVVPEDFDIVDHSGKLVLLFNILQKCELIGDKVLVFSQSLLSLDVIEHFLDNIDELTQKMGTETVEDSQNTEKTNKFIGSWSKGLDYFRIDGSVSPENRSIWCKSFNSPHNLRARLFLISTRAGGMGINLIGANRVILFDASWNPSNDLQSIFRIYRFGQTKPCYVYRFLAQGTMEERIYNRQVTKLSLALRVVDEHQIERHFNLDDLQELYRYEPKQKTDRPTPILPKDRLLAELIQKYPDLIDNYHEHDSLLENKTEEELTEEERKAAWEDFENDKKGVLPAVNLPVGGAGAFGGMVSQMMYGTNVYGENAQALRQAILDMYPNATEEQLASEMSRAASRISEYFTNPSYPQMQPYYDQVTRQLLNTPAMNLYAGQGPRYPQQTPLLSNQYGLQNYYHNPVLPSTSVAQNINRVIQPLVGNNSYNPLPSVSIRPMQPGNIQANVPSCSNNTTALKAPLIKIRKDLLDPSVTAANDNDVIVETVRRREV